MKPDFIPAPAACERGALVAANVRDFGQEVPAADDLGVPTFLRRQAQKA